MNTYFDKAGVHVASPIELALTQAKTGSSGIRILFRIEGGDYDGELVCRDLWLTQSAWPYTLKALRCCGATIDGLDADQIVARIEAGTLEGFGRRVKLVVGEEAGLDGEPVFRVKFVNPMTDKVAPGAGSPADLRAKATALLGKFLKPKEALADSNAEPAKAESGANPKPGLADNNGEPAQAQSEHAVPGSGPEEL